MRRLKDGIIESCRKFTTATEIPEIFSIWAAISAISAALGRDCFYDFDYYQIYPNLFIVFIARSAWCRKSSAIRIAEKFIKAVKPPIKVLSPKTTPEWLIGALSGVDVRSGDETILHSAEGIIVADELSTFIDRNAFKNGMISLLTDLYDNDDFEYSTKGRGTETVRNPCLSILGGSTVQWIKEAIPTVSISGGFTSRLVLVYWDTPRPGVSRPKMSEGDKQIKKDIVYDLCQVAKLRGRFEMTDEAGSFYDYEYNRFRKESHLIDDVTLDGYAGRRHDILVKVSMIVSASKRDDKRIEKGDIEDALKLMLGVESFMPTVMQAITAKEIGDVFDEITRFLAKHKKLSKAQLVKRFRNKMTAPELDVMLETLEQEKVVSIQVDGKTTEYRFIGDKNDCLK